jgi:cysteine synthase A
MQISEDNTSAIGNTPLVKINRMARGLGARVLAKIEGRNPSYSVKCRIGASMVWEAERTGELKPGGTILEATSGNTGIGLAYAAAARGYRCLLCMPDTMSMERRRVLAALGAELVLTPGHLGMKGALERAEQIEAADASVFYARQFENPANPAIHERTTGPEIWRATRGEIDVLVCGVGTGGTITGISRYIKLGECKPILSVAVEPAQSPVITQTLSKRPLVPGAHKIQGLGSGFVPRTLDLAMVDRVMCATDEEAFTGARRLATEEGILAGISSGAAVMAALKLAESAEMKGKTIVVVLPDAAERYLSGPLFDAAPEPAAGLRS